MTWRLYLQEYRRPYEQIFFLFFFFCRYFLQLCGIVIRQNLLGFADFLITPDFSMITDSKWLEVSLHICPSIQLNHNLITMSLFDIHGKIHTILYGNDMLCRCVTIPCTCKRPWRQRALSGSPPHVRLYVCQFVVRLTVMTGTSTQQLLHIM